MPENFYNSLSKNISHPSDLLWKACELEVLKQSSITFKNPIIDIGSGNGFLMDSFFDKRVIDFGIDAHPWKNQSQAYREIICSDIEKECNFSNDSINTVLSFVTLHLLSNLDFVLIQIHRILSKNGILIFTVPSNEFSKMLFFNFLGSWYAKYRNKKLKNYHLYSEEEWRLILKKKGFKEIRIIGFMGGNKLKLWDFLASIYFFSLGRYAYNFLRKVGFEKYIKSLSQREDKKSFSAFLIIAKKK